MEITRTSQFSGKTRTRNIDITEKQYDAWMNGLLIQKAMPNISADDREFIMTGITPEEWEEFSLEEEEEESDYEEEPF